jgi:membrane protein DedA with SNARE-associated domain
MGEIASFWLPDMTAVGAGLLAVAFLAQALKEMGIPSPGVTQGLLVLAGTWLARGDFPLALGLIGCTLLGSLTGASAIYTAGRLYGTKIVQRWGRYIGITPEKMEKVRKRRLSFVALTISRSIPGLMAPTSLTAGVLRLPVGLSLASVAISTIFWIAILVALGDICGDIVLRLLPTKYITLALGLFAGTVIITSVCLIWRRHKAEINKARMSDAL